MLVVAQHQHNQILDAIAQREGARAEAIMKEYLRLAQRNLKQHICNPLPTVVPGLGLIR